MQVAGEAMRVAGGWGQSRDAQQASGRAPLVPAHTCRLSSCEARSPPVSMICTRVSSAVSSGWNASAVKPTTNSISPSSAVMLIHTCAAQ